MTFIMLPGRFMTFIMLVGRFMTFIMLSGRFITFITLSCRFITFIVFSGRFMAYIMLSGRFMTYITLSGRYITYITLLGRFMIQKRTTSTIQDSQHSGITDKAKSNYFKRNKLCWEINLITVSVIGYTRLYHGPLFLSIYQSDKISYTILSNKDS